MKYKAKKVYEHTLQSVREAVGLASPSKVLYTCPLAMNHNQLIQGMRQLQLKKMRRQVAVSNNYYHLVTPVI